MRAAGRIREARRRRVHVPEMWTSRLEELSGVDQHRIAIERRRDRITYVKCCLPQEKECAPEITCIQCHTPKPLCDYPETAEQIMARAHKTAAFASSRMVCQSCKDAKTHCVCSECNVSKPRDKMPGRQGTKGHHTNNRCAECAYPTCASCGTQ